MTDRMTGDNERTLLARKAVMGDLWAARKLVERDLALDDSLPPYDPDTPLNDVDWESAGVNRSWAGRVKNHVLGGAWSWGRSRPNPPHTLRHLAIALSRHAFPAGLTRQKVLRVLARAGLEVTLAAEFAGMGDWMAAVSPVNPVNPPRDYKEAF